MEDKNLQLERLVFFSDAVVAIAITLLALDLRIEHTETGHLQFSDIAAQWKTLAAFLLSFFNIANFWRTHHSFFVHIKKIDEKLLWFNILWLLFIIFLPFSTSLVSGYFTDVAAISVYCFNILMIAIFQNMIWDYSSDHHFLDKSTIDDKWEGRIRAFCNLDMLNSLVGLAVSWFSPVIAFIILFTKLPTILIAGIYYRRFRKSGHHKN